MPAKRTYRAPPEIPRPEGWTPPGAPGETATAADLDAHAGPQGAELVSISRRQLANLKALHTCAAMIVRSMEGFERGGPLDIDCLKELRRWLPQLDRLRLIAGCIEDEARLTKRGL